MKIFNFVILAATGILINSCSKSIPFEGDETVAGGTETGNAFSSIVTNAGGDAVANAEVIIIPSTYSPFSKADPVITYTNDTGFFELNVMVEGTYTIQITEISSGQGLFLFNVDSSFNQISDSQLVLQEMQSVVLPTEKMESGGIIYIDGTTHAENVVDSNVSQGFLVLDSVALDTVPIVHYSKDSNNIVLIDEYFVNSKYDSLQIIFVDSIEMANKDVNDTIPLPVDTTLVNMPTFISEGDFGGVPFLDWSADSSRHFLIDQISGTDLTNPHSVFWNGDTLFTVYNEGANWGNTIISQSNNGGITWSRVVQGAQGIGYANEIPTIWKLNDSTGQKRLVIIAGLYPAITSISEDGGNTWTPYRNITWVDSSGDTLSSHGGIVMFSEVIPLKNQSNDLNFLPGKYMALFHDDGKNINGSGIQTSNNIYKTITLDGGITWMRPEIIHSDNLFGFQLSTPSVLRSPDGRQLVMVVSDFSRKSNSGILLSQDEGITWSGRKELPNSISGNRHRFKYLPDGRVISVFREFQNDTNNLFNWDLVAWVGTYQDLVNRASGDFRVRLFEKQGGESASYPEIHILNDYSIYITTYLQYNSDENKSIWGTRFTLSELTSDLNR